VRIPLLLASTVVTVAVLVPVRTVDAASVIEHPCAGTWRVVPTPSVSEPAAFLGIAMIPGTRMLWAVGHDGAQGLIEEWSGRAWDVVPSPSVGDTNLFGVTAASAADAWAVGISYATGVGQTFIERWDGTAWSVVPSPNASASFNGLLSVTSSGNRAIAVGDFVPRGSSGSQPLIERWNGSSWRLQRSPSVTAGASLASVTRVPGAPDAWAVGSEPSGSGTLVEHWDGTVWTVVPDAGPPAGASLMGVTALAPDDVVAVGRVLTSRKSYGPFAERWDGTAWTAMPTQVMHPSGSLEAVAMSSATNGWAVGYQYQKSGVSTPLVERWDGSGWSVVLSPVVNYGVLFGVARGARGSIFAAGYVDGTAPSNTLAESC